MHIYTASGDLFLLPPAKVKVWVGAWLRPGPGPQPQHASPPSPHWVGQRTVMVAAMAAGALALGALAATGPLSGKGLWQGRCSSILLPVA